MCLAPLTKDHKYLHKGSSKMAEGRVAVSCVLRIEEIEGTLFPDILRFCNGVRSTFTASRVRVGGWDSASAGSASCSSPAVP